MKSQEWLFDASAVVEETFSPVELAVASVWTHLRKGENLREKLEALKDRLASSMEKGKVGDGCAASDAYFAVTLYLSSDSHHEKQKIVVTTLLHRLPQLKSAKLAPLINVRLFYLVPFTRVVQVVSEKLEKSHCASETAVVSGQKLLKNQMAMDEKGSQKREIVKETKKRALILSEPEPKLVSETMKKPIEQRKSPRLAPSVGNGHINAIMMPLSVEFRPFLEQKILEKRSELDELENFELEKDKLGNIKLDSMDFGSGVSGSDEADSVEEEKSKKKTGRKREIQRLNNKGLHGAPQSTAAATLTHGPSWSGTGSKTELDNYLARHSLLESCDVNVRTVTIPIGSLAVGHLAFLDSVWAAFGEAGVCSSEAQSRNESQGSFFPFEVDGMTLAEMLDRKLLRSVAIDSNSILIVRREGQEEPAAVFFGSLIEESVARLASNKFAVTAGALFGTHPGCFLEKDQRSDDGRRGVIKVGVQKAARQNQANNQPAAEYAAIGKLSVVEAKDLNLVTSLLASGEESFYKIMNPLSPKSLDHAHKRSEAFRSKFCSDLSLRVSLPFDRLFSSMWMTFNNTLAHRDTSLGDTSKHSMCIWIGDFQKKHHFVLAEWGLILKHSSGSAAFFESELLHGSLHGADKEEMQNSTVMTMALYQPRGSTKVD